MRTAERRLGQLLGGKYRLDEVLATGGMGIVYGGVHVATGRAVAIKLLRPELVHEPDLVRRVSAEARLAVEASHPNVVEVLDAGADEQGVPYLVLERLQGDTLEAWLGERLSLLATVQVLVPIVNALAALHRSGILHRDVKPSNIFVHRDGAGRVTPKLLDFGIAKALEGAGATLTGVALGTPAYMAPEQALGISAAGPGSDVWAVAVVFVRCLTGRLPFAEGVAQRAGVLRGGLTTEHLRDVPAPVVAVLSRALRLDPSERHSSMVEFRSALLGAAASTDASVSWPSESTSGYDADHWALGPSPRAAAPLSQRREQLGRPRDVPTRTLSPVPASPPRRLPWRTLALLALAAMAASMALQVGSGDPRPAGSIRAAAPGLDAFVAALEVPVEEKAGAALDRRPGALGAAASTPAPDASAPAAGSSPRAALAPEPNPSPLAPPGPSSKADPEKLRQAARTRREHLAKESERRGELDRKPEPEAKEDRNRQRESEPRTELDRKAELERAARLGANRSPIIE